jgi:hypothetical protein
VKPVWAWTGRLASAMKNASKDGSMRLATEKTPKGREIDYFRVLKNVDP